MSAQISSTAFTDPTVLFASMAVANQWRTSLVVPSATLSTEGSVKAGSAPVNGVTPSASSGVTLSIANPDGSTSSYTVATKADLDSTISSLTDLTTKFNTLITNLKSAGVLI
jgi:hypothetical protein